MKTGIPLVLLIAAGCLEPNRGVPTVGDRVSRGDELGPDGAGDARGPGDNHGPGDPSGPGDLGGDDARVAQTVTLQLDVGGTLRTFDVYVPASYVAPSPLVLDIHCHGCDRDWHASRSGVRELADARGFVVAFPDGIGHSFNAGSCCGEAQSQNIDDVSFMLAIVQRVSTTWSIDASRVYSTGLSNGGAMSHRLACEAAHVFAAVAPISYPLAVEPMSDCQPSRPIPVFQFHGVNDTVVPYDGGGSYAAPPVSDSFSYWAQVNGCGAPSSTIYVQGSSVCTEMPACDAGGQSVLCSITGGHILYSNDDDVDIVGLAWTWMSQHTLP